MEKRLQQKKYACFVENMDISVVYAHIIFQEVGANLKQISNLCSSEFLAKTSYKGSFKLVYVHTQWK